MFPGVPQLRLLHGQKLLFSDQVRRNLYPFRFYYCASPLPRDVLLFNRLMVLSHHFSAQAPVSKTGEKFRAAGDQWRTRSTGPLFMNQPGQYMAWAFVNKVFAIICRSDKNLISQNSVAQTILCVSLSRSWHSSHSFPSNTCYLQFATADLWNVKVCWAWSTRVSIWLASAKQSRRSKRHSTRKKLQGGAEGCVACLACQLLKRQKQMEPAPMKIDTLLLLEAEQQGAIERMKTPD